MPLPTPAGELRPVNHVEKVQLNDFNMLSNAVTMVVPDEIIDTLTKTETPASVIVNIMYAPGVDAESLPFEEIVENEDVPGMTNVQPLAFTVPLSAYMPMLPVPASPADVNSKEQSSAVTDEFAPADVMPRT